MKIVPLENILNKGEHDKVWKGKIVRLDIRPAKNNGFILVYEMECDIQPLGDMGPTVQHNHAICGVMVKSRWWHKIFGITDKRRIATGMKKLQKRWEEMVAHTKQFDDIRESYGIQEGVLDEY